MDSIQFWKKTNQAALSYTSKILFQPEALHNTLKWQKNSSCHV